MRIILNATTLVKGGALQACVSFIRQAVQKTHHIQWYFIISQEIAYELQEFEVDIEQMDMYVVSPSPAKCKQSRIKTCDIINEIDPSAVFTFFGPAYISIDYPHLMGVADGWITHSSILAIKKKGGAQALLRLFFLFIYKRYWYKKATHWVVEAECAKRGMLKRFHIKQDSISIIQNNCGDHYNEVDRMPAPLAANRKKILTLSSYYIHKNIEIIPYVAFELKKLRGCDDFVFILTIEKDTTEESNILASASNLNVAAQIENLGPITVRDGPALYATSFLTFMPSLLETFSAVYPESMMSGRPIVTCDLEFAHDICHDAAMYYNALDARDAAYKINEIMSSVHLYNSLVSHGFSIVSNLPSQSEKYQLYEKVLVDMLAKPSLSEMN